MRDRNDPGAGSTRARYPGGFLLAFREQAGKLGWTLERLELDVAVCIDEDGAPHCIGLENLYRQARHIDRGEWPELIAGFLGTIQGAEHDHNMPADLAEVAERLLPRVGRPLKLDADAAPVWNQPILGTDLVVNLVVDYPDRMCYVSEGLMASATRPANDWVETACANLRRQTPTDCFQLVDAETGIYLCCVGDAYDSSRALLLDAVMPVPVDDGCLIVMPGRDELVALPVTREALSRIHLLKLLAEKKYRTTPYPITDDVFWVCDGIWHSFTIDITGNDVNIQPPTEFVDVLERLSPWEDGEGTV